MTDTDTDTDYILFERGLPWHQAAFVSGALVLGMALIHFQTGAPAGYTEWAASVVAIIVSPAIAYAALDRRWGLTLMNIIVYLWAFLSVY